MTLSMGLLVSGSLLQSPGGMWAKLGILVSSSVLISDLFSVPVLSFIAALLSFPHLENGNLSDFPDTMTI